MQTRIKNLEGNSKGKNQRRQYLLAVGLDRYKTGQEFGGLGDCRA